MRSKREEMKTVACSVLVLGAMLAMPAAVAQQAALEQDANVVASLKQHGAALSKPHNVDFYLVLPTKSAAKSVASELASMGYSVRSTSRVKKSDSWEVHAQRNVAPRLDTMQGITVKPNKPIMFAPFVRPTRKSLRPLLAAYWWR
jgi:hypothetical protein